METIIPIEDCIDDHLVKRFKKKVSVRKSKERRPPLSLRIRSYGGNMRAFLDISQHLYLAGKTRNVIGQAEYAESAALLLFINCPVREVTEKSIGIIHLPELRVGGDATISSTKIVNEVIDFIIGRTKMTESMIRNLEGQKLNAIQMLELGIATKIVPSFSNRKEPRNYF